MTIEDDGTFRLWRSVGWATCPPTPVGRFGGRLDAAERMAVEEEVAQAVRAGPQEVALRADSPTEHVSFDGAQLLLGIHDVPENSWAPLILRLRALVGQLTAFPDAAIGLEVAPDAEKARLVHLGAEPLLIGLRELKVRAVLWQDEAPVANWYPPPGEELQEVTASGGWVLDLPFAHGLPIEPGCRVTAYVNFEAFDGDDLIPVSLEGSFSTR